MKFANLHAHSHYSLFDGAMSPLKMAEECEREGHVGCAITDHGNMGGVFEFWKVFTDRDLKPVLGCEFYAFNRKATYHITVLAQTFEGYQNLVRLNNLANTPERFYKKPRIKFTDLETHSDGIIVLSGCVGGIIPQLLKHCRYKASIETALWFKNLLKDNFYIEIQPAPNMSPDLVAKLCHLAQRVGVPTIATADSHHGCFDYEIFKAITQTARREMAFEEIALPFGTLRTVAGLPSEAINMSYELLDSVEKINLKPRQPYFPVISTDYIELMLNVARANCECEQLQYEIEIIAKAGFLPYFYVLFDLKKYCKDNAIAWGPGRGSAAGSLFAYAIGITEVDPRRHNLIFERFLNPERVSLPDIDVDIEDEKRHTAIKYLQQRWGSVYHISTYQSVGFSTAVRDVARSLGGDFETQQAIAELVPKPVRGVYPSDEECVNALVGSSLVSESFLDIVKAVKGKPKSQGMHSGGIVIVPNDAPVVPLGGSKTTANACAWNMHGVEEAGYVKYDLLGLKSVSLCAVLRRQFNYKPNPFKDWDDSISSILESGNTFGVAQLGSSGLAKFCKDFKPKNIEELAEVLALYRPGPLDAGIAQAVLDIRNGKVSGRDTGLLFIYQEQIMQYAQRVAAYSMAQADRLRKAIGKKIPEELAKYQKDFEPEAWQAIEKFGAYGFNKAHAVAYAYLSFETAWWKVKHPAAFYAAILNLYSSNSVKKSQALIQAKYSGLCVLLPHAIEDWETTGDGKNLALGCNLLKGLKAKPSKPNSTAKKALDAVNGDKWIEQLSVLGAFLSAVDTPKGYGVVCAVEKKTSFASGKIYYNAIVDTGNRAVEVYAKKKPELADLIQVLIY
jgi:DNA polymerase III subunit alpha